MSRLHTGAFLLAALAMPLAVAQTTATPKDAPPAPARADQGGEAGADPRVCLEFPTNLQVMACAEKYRPRRSAR